MSDFKAKIINASNSISAGAPPQTSRQLLWELTAFPQTRVKIGGGGLDPPCKWGNTHCNLYTKNLGGSVFNPPQWAPCAACLLVSLIWINPLTWLQRRLDLLIVLHCFVRLTLLSSSSATDCSWFSSLAVQYYSISFLIICIFNFDVRFSFGKGIC